MLAEGDVSHASIKGSRNNSTAESSQKRSVALSKFENLNGILREAIEIQIFGNMTQ